MLVVPESTNLWLCEQTIIDRRTNNPTLVGIFIGLAVRGFPSSGETFSVFAALTNGLGRGTIELVVLEPPDDERIYRQAGTVNFPDRQVVVNADFRVRIRFNGPGLHMFVVRIENEMVAWRRLRVYAA